MNKNTVFLCSLRHLSQDARVVATPLTIKNCSGRSSFSDRQREFQLPLGYNIAKTYLKHFLYSLELLTHICIISLYFSAKALQTILVLTGPQSLYKRWADKSQDLNVEWNMDAAKQVLEAWQRSFTKVKF